MKKILILFVSLFTAFSSFAQNAEQFSGSLLWKVSGKDLQKPSYIFGTYHLLGGSHADSIVGLRDAIDNTVQAVGEIDMSDAAALQAKVMQAGMMPAEQSYKTLLSEDEYAKLDEGLKKAMMGMGLDQMGMFKPGMISSSLAIFMYMRLNPTFNPTAFEGIDSYLQRIVRENDKNVMGLETVEDQVAILFDREPLDIQVKSLMCSVENLDFSVEKLGELTADYYAGDLNKMYASYDDPTNPCIAFVTQEGKDALLKNRNDKWLAQLPQIMNENPTLVIVGALHLAGEEGLLYQLDKMGYKVEAVK